MPPRVPQMRYPDALDDRRVPEACRGADEVVKESTARAEKDRRDVDTLNVMGSDPPVLNSKSPEDMDQLSTSATPSLPSATNPSRDIDMRAIIFDTLGLLCHYH